MTGTASRASRPAIAVSFPLLAGLCLALAALAPAGCADGLPPAADAPAGATRGELVRYVLTMEEGGMEEHFYLRTRPDQPEVRLLFTTPPGFGADATGKLIDVWGHPVADGLRVDRFAVVSSPTETTSHALITDQPLKTRRLAFVLVDLGQGVRLTKAEAERRLFGTAAGDRSVRQYFVEASYGRQDIAGEVFGPIRGTMSGCNFPQLAQSLRGSVPAGFDHYLWYFGTRVGSCGFAGVALSGMPARPQRDTWYNASHDCVVLVQEPAHNFGTMHSSSMKCGTQTFVDNPRGACTHREYGDFYDPMGSACRHMNGYQKAFQGWFGGCNVVDVNESGTFTLLPIETPCDGPQLLQVRMPKGRPFAHAGGGPAPTTTELTHYYVEFRAPIGFDTGLPPQVQVRVSGDIRQRTQRGFNTWILDMNPATPPFDGLGVGGTFTDPAGSVKFTVMAIDGKAATVKVDITGGTGGAPTCMDGKPLPNPAPGPASCAASVATPGGAPPAVPPSDAGTTPTPPPSDAGTTPPPSGTGGAPGGLSPVGYDALGTEGFKDAGPGTPSEPLTPGAGGSGPSTPRGTGGTTTTTPAVDEPVPSGGCACEVGTSKSGPNGLGLLLSLAFAALVIRRR